MAGSLFHAKQFTIRHYIGNDGQAHLEVCGEADGVSWSSWANLKQFGETIGIPREVWPEFVDCDSGIDVDVDSAAQKSELFKSYCARIPKDDSYPYWFGKILFCLDL